MSVARKPWEIGPTELISFALERMHGDTDFDRRLAFLILDVGVETLVKTFLSLPVSVSGAVSNSEERYKATRGNFHDLVDGLLAAIPERITHSEIEDIRYYHKVRNTLYHQGDTVAAVRTDHLEQYATLAVLLLKQLFELDLSLKLESPEPVVIDDADTLLESREVVLSSGRYRIERYRSNAIKVINVNTDSKEIAKPFLRKIISEMDLDVSLNNSKGNAKNTQQLGKDILKALKISAWHGWISGQKLHRDTIVSALLNRLRDGFASDQKWEVVDYLRNIDHDWLIFTPTGSGIGNSPFNLRCWRSVTGDPI